MHEMLIAVQSPAEEPGWTSTTPFFLRRGGEMAIKRKKKSFRFKKPGWKAEPWGLCEFLTNFWRCIFLGGEIFQKLPSGLSLCYCTSSPVAEVLILENKSWGSSCSHTSPTNTRTSGGGNVGSWEWEKLWGGQQHWKLGAGGLIFSVIPSASLEIVSG